MNKATLFFDKSKFLIKSDVDYGSYFFYLMIISDQSFAKPIEQKVQNFIINRQGIYILLEYFDEFYNSQAFIKNLNQVIISKNLFIKLKREVGTMTLDSEFQVLENTYFYQNKIKGLEFPVSDLCVSLNNATYRQILKIHKLFTVSDSIIIDSIKPEIDIANATITNLQKPVSVKGFVYSLQVITTNKYFWSDQTKLIQENVMKSFGVEIFINTISQKNTIYLLIYYKKINQRVMTGVVNNFVMKSIRDLSKQKNLDLSKLKYSQRMIEISKILVYLGFK
ncbi:hypothetical protein HC864_00375 [Candidatus Gracilibacteria bacterium]|nr:hypothetical protein [Candidatus Gracilibacteria bacterium]